MPSIDFVHRADRRRAAGEPATPAQPWEDAALKRVTARVQEVLREDCPTLLESANLEEGARREILARIQSLLAGNPDLHVRGYTQALLAQHILDYVAGLGPLQPLLHRPEVSEIMVNRWDDVWVEVSGRLQRAPEVRFRDDMHVFYLAQRVLAPLGIELSAAAPLATGRMAGNIRVAASMPPVSPYCSLNIRKPSLEHLTREEYLRHGFAAPEMLDLLEAAARGRANILIAGPTGTGKSTLLRYLGHFFPREARLLLLESTAELGLDQFHPHVLAFECRGAGHDGRHGVDMEQILIHALHRRPDYIIVGEVRGAESLQLLMAMATGHPGASTVHAESPDRLFDRLALAILQARLAINNDQVLKYLAEAVDLVAYVERMADGSRKLTALAEIEGFQDGNPVLRSLYQFEPRLVSPERVEGDFCPVHPCSGRLRRKLSRWGVLVDGLPGPLVRPAGGDNSREPAVLGAEHVVGTLAASRFPVDPPTAPLGGTDPAP